MTSTVSGTSPAYECYFIVCFTKILISKIRVYWNRFAPQTSANEIQWWSPLSSTEQTVRSALILFAAFSSFSGGWEHKNGHQTSFFSWGMLALGRSVASRQAWTPGSDSRGCRFCFYLSCCSFSFGTILMTCLAKLFEIGVEKSTSQMYYLMGYDNLGSAILSNLKFVWKSACWA